MAKYKFHIRNYHAIQDAEIKIDGISVLAGINGCGKSTLSRWLYYLIDSTSKYEKFQKKRICDFIDLEIRRSGRIILDPSQWYEYRTYFNDTKRLSEADTDFGTKAYEIFESFTNRFTIDLLEYLTKVSSAEMKRTAGYILRHDISSLETILRHDSAIDGELLVQLAKDDMTSRFNQEMSSYNESIQKKSIKDLIKIINKEYGEKDEMPKEMGLSEDEVWLMEEGCFTEPLMLNNAIYIDTPMALSGQANPDEGTIWYRFKELLQKHNDKSENDEITKYISKIIQKTIHGNIELAKDEFGLSPELRYVREDGLNICIEDTATGIKSFSYILRLVENCWLNNETLLMIDEPEAHLHPQWVVEFARILVLIHKNLGTKILVASHDPDMISAIHDISEYYGVEKETNFYIADRESPDSSKYVFKDLGHEIGQIFDSFNLAIARISDFASNN